MSFFNKLLYFSVLGALSSSSVYADQFAIPSIDVTVNKVPVSITQPAIDAARLEMENTAGGITIVDAEQIREGRMSDYHDTLGVASGVYVQSRFGSEESRLSIRGSGLQRVFNGRGIKLMQDGIPVNQADGSFDFPAIDPYATNYIEVYRGANALQFGASNLGGSINFVSPTGYTAPKLEVRGELGSFGYKRMGVSAGGVVGDLDYFVALSGYSQDSFRNDADQDARRLNGNLGYKINDDVETRFYFGYTNSDSQMPGNLSKRQLKNNPEFSQNQESPGSPVLSGTGVWEHNINLWRAANKTTFDFDDTQLELGVFYSKHDLYHPIADLAYLSFLHFPPFSTGTFNTLGVVDQKSDDYGLTAKLKHNGQLAGMKNIWVLGINPTYGETRDRRYRNVSAHKGALTNDFDMVASNFEAFAEDRLYLTRDLSVVAGLQYTHSKRKADDNFINPATGNESYSKTYSQTSPKLGLIYELQQHVKLFANVSRSFEPPSFGELLDPTAANRLKAQTGTTFEIGMRGNTEDVDWDVAVYYAKIRNEMLSVSPIPGVTDTINADKAIHAGLEMGMTARLPLKLEWRQNLLINNFKLDDDLTFGNNRLPGMQRVLLRAELLYRNNGFYIGPTLELSPERYSVDFAETLYADSYSLWGVKAGMKYDEHWSWFVEGRNIADKKYAASTDVIRAANATKNDAVFLPGDGRSFYAGFQWRY